MAKIKITLAQISAQEDLLEIKDIIQKRKSSDLIIFPEAVLKINSSETIKELQGLVKQHSTAIVIGVLQKQKEKICNFAYYISPDKIVSYQKVHVHWTEKCNPGKKFEVIKTPFGKIGLLICFDAAFQEAGRILALMGVEIIVIINAIPSHFPSKIVSLRSQAIALNNQVFVIDCYKSGKEFRGHGAIFSPSGQKIVQIKKHQLSATKTIDLKEIEEWRKKEKIFSNRKPKLYKIIATEDKNF
jgi:deaminated glutathione amidase